MFRRPNGETYIPSWAGNPDPFLDLNLAQIQVQAEDPAFAVGINRKFRGRHA